MHLYRTAIAALETATETSSAASKAWTVKVPLWIAATSAFVSTEVVFLKIVHIVLCGKYYIID